MLPHQPLTRSGGRLNAFSAVQFAITGDPDAIRDVADTNPVPVWAWIMLTLIVAASFFACISAWVFASAGQSLLGPPLMGDMPSSSSGSFSPSV